MPFESFESLALFDSLAPFLSIAPLGPDATGALSAPLHYQLRAYACYGTVG